MRILHILAPAEFGGLERVVSGLAVGQRERGHHTHVLAILDRGREQNHPVVTDLAALGVELTAMGLPPRAYLRERRAVRAALTALRPDVVHTHGARVDVLDGPVARRAGFPTVVTVHGFTGGGARNRLYEQLQLRAIRGASAVVAVSEAQVPTLVAAGVREERIHTVPNAWLGMERPLSRTEARRQLGVGDVDGPLVGWVGRFTLEKGADTFLEAIANLGDGRVRGILVGDGPQRAALASLADRLGIARLITWTGSLRHAARVLPAFDLLAMSSRTEGTPMVLFEAIAAGVPVVATAVGGVPHVVGPREVLLVQPDDPVALAGAIRGALADRPEAAARARLARARIETAFRVDPWLDQYDVIYHKVRNGCQLSRS